jgi:hypothetical protein
MERQLALLSQYRCRHPVGCDCLTGTDLIRAKKAEVEGLRRETDAVGKKRTDATAGVKQITEELAADNVSPDPREGRSWTSVDWRKSGMVSRVFG